MTGNKEFTGVSAPYEAPENPEIHLHTDDMSVEQCVQRVLEYLVEKELVRG
jgi:adenylylsulfate kinase-like enzyme